MNNTLTPQEASLYLGQEIQYDRPGMKANGHSNYTFTAILSGNLYQQILEGRADNCKLFLRPLEDITEEEAKEIYFLIYGEECEGIRENGLTYLKVIYSHEEWWSPDIILSLGRPKVWQYLLSKGFDLFGHIEAGKALDKTKR